MKYVVINVKESKMGDADNVAISCYVDEKTKYLLAGSSTATLKMRRADFDYVIRNHGYSLGELEGKQIQPVFGRYDMVEDFTLVDLSTGEVK